MKENLDFIPELSKIMRFVSKTSSLIRNGCFNQIEILRNIDGNGKIDRCRDITWHTLNLSELMHNFYHITDAIEQNDMVKTASECEGYICGFEGFIKPMSEEHYKDFKERGGVGGSETFAFCCEKDDFPCGEWENAFHQALEAFRIMKAKAEKFQSVS